MENGLTLRDFLHLVRRRKWIVLQTVVLVTLVVTALSVSQPKLYQSHARVLLSFQNLANQLSGVSGGSNVVQQPDRFARTQAGVARTSAVAARVLHKVPGSGLSAGALLGQSDVSPNPNADVLVFTDTNRNPTLARRLVNAYAAEYVSYRHELDAAPILRARANVQATLKRLPTTGTANAELRAQLVERDQTLAHHGSASDVERLGDPTGRRRRSDPATGQTERDARGLPRPDPRACLRLPLGDARHPSEEHRRHREAAGRSAAPRPRAGAEQTPAVREPARADRRAGRSGGGAVPDASHEPRLRHARPGHPDDHGDERRRG